jgi:hypothetical protein
MRPLRAFPSYALAVALLVSPHASAQVNVEPLRQQVAEDGFGARLRASLTSYAGNTRGLILGGAALMGMRTHQHLAYVDLSSDYTRLNGEVSVAKWFAHARHNYQLLPWLWWEEFGQLESDRFRRVTVRELIGTGPRFGLYQTEAFETFYGASYMYEHTVLTTSDRRPVGQGGVHRFNNYVAVTLRAHERVSLSSVTYFQPRFDRPSDLTLLSVSSAIFTITDRLKSRVDATVRYESVTPSDVTSGDLELKSSLEVVF